MVFIKDLQKSYDIGKSKLHVLKGINLDISEGEFVSIMGSSGSGKSTLLNIIGILDQKDSGIYELDGIPIEHLNEAKAAEYRSRFLGFVFQSFNLISYKTALENVALPLYYQNVSRKERNQRALDYLEKVGLADWANRLPNELSGGQKQRVAIARALITDPRIILADEPTGALDSKTTHDIMKLLQEINNQGKTIIIVKTNEPVRLKSCIGQGSSPRGNRNQVLCASETIVKGVFQAIPNSEKNNENVKSQRHCKARKHRPKHIAPNRTKNLLPAV